MSKRHSYLTLLLLLCTFVPVLGAASASALAATPWWHIASGASPTVLQGGLAKDSVQKLTITGTKGDVLIGSTNGYVTGHALVPFNVEASVLRKDIETQAYPGHSAQVSEEATAQAHTKVFVITFPDQSVFSLRVGSDNFPYDLFFGGEPLENEGVPSEPTASVISEGRPDGEVFVTATNLGDAPAEGGTVPVSITDSLPPGFKAVAITGVAGENRNSPFGPVACELASLSCKFEGVLPPFSHIEVRVDVVVEPGAVSGSFDEAAVSGGGAPTARSLRRPLTIGAANPFGIEDYELALEEDGGAPDTQAGSHPFQFTTTLAFNQKLTVDENIFNEVLPTPAVLPKDVKFNLPAGLVGNPTPLPQCSLGAFLSDASGFNLCAPRTAVGVAVVTYNEAVVLGVETVTVPVFNLEPNSGEPARFGFLLPVTPVVIDTAVRSGGDYGITASVSNISQTAGLLRTEVTLWGVPGDPRHDSTRGNGCLAVARGVPGTCDPLGESNPPPFILMPSICNGPLQTSATADSWAEPKTPLTAGPSEPLQALDGCNRLPFTPSINVTPDASAASSPTGVTVDQHVPQESMMLSKGLAESAVKGLSITLPEGVVLNPAAADGLQACSIGQVDLQGGQEPACPEASKVGTVKVKTPLLPEPLEGAAYLATQNANPFGSLIALYISAFNPKSGVRVKATGEVTEDPVTGQITARFEHDPLFEGQPQAAQYLPPVPFEDVEVHFFGGDRAPLATPAHCGSYSTTGTFTPWSGEPGQAPYVPSPSTFQISSGPHGGPCPAATLPFGPSLAGGTTNINAGAFSPLTTTIGREDGNQDIGTVQLHMPAGLSGILSGVKLCPEAQANAGTCGPESLIGHTIVSVGLGGDPFSVTGGQVFLTEHYKGAPFGLSIVNPAKAGPFDLGKVIVRATIQVDPSTAALTITTDAIPHILQGIPLQIKHVNVTVDRSGFTFNPTSCNPQSLTGSISSAQGASAPVSVPFQVTNCAALKFAPGFKVSTSGKTSKANGASLNVKLTYPSAPFGSQANIKSVKVDLPKQLPSRLTTLQKACTAKQFETDPAGCPSASVVGHARAITPLIPVALEGPAYFVSHGGEAFPSLIVVLQGYGVTLDLVGSTFISKAGITSSTFKTVPDAPVGSFELNLPQGKYSALAANGNLCASNLAMPTEFQAQNGAVIHQSTPIAATGCAKKKTLTRAQKLVQALKTCHKDRDKGKRATCERAAHKRYGPIAKKKQKKK